MAQAMKIVDVANYCLKEVAKHAGDSHRYIVQCKTPKFQHSLTFQHTTKTTAGRKKLFAHIIVM